MLGSIALAHGSRSPGQASVVGELARLAQQRDGSLWRPAFLDHHGPALQDAVSELVGLGCRTLIVVPTLLSNAFHSSIDIPAAVDALSTDASVTIAEPVGPDALLFDVVARHVRAARIHDAKHQAAKRVVVAAAGTSVESAREQFRVAVARWSATLHDVDATAAFIAGGAPDVSDAVGSALADGTGPLVVPFTLAGGSLTERARAQALIAGAEAFLPPLGAADEVITILLDRRDACATV